MNMNGSAKSNQIFFFFLFVLAVIIPTLRADVEYVKDDVWRQREAEAKNATLEAYQPRPEEVARHFNLHVRMVLEGTNTTRRYLKRKDKGACLAVNPIDRCWRCQRNWADNRKRLADCVLGFGRKTFGGKYGNFYLVTDSSDNDLVNPKPGTLRHAVIQREPLWIIFKKDMIIRLQQELIMTGDKTIDGRGAKVHIAYGAGITIQFIKNVIIHGLYIHDIKIGGGGIIRDSITHSGFRGKSDGDGINIYGSSNIWIDHISMWNCADGLIDAIQGSTAITISNCHFTHHIDVILLGGHDTDAGDKLMQVTVAFNHFGKGLEQRMPRCRLGFFHVVNNDYTHWLMYAIGGSMHPTIVSQGNRFIAPPNPKAKEITHRDKTPEEEWKRWTWISDGDLLMNGAYFRESGNQKQRFPFDMIKAMPGTHVTKLTLFSGALGCKVGREC